MTRNTLSNSVDSMLQGLSTPRYPVDGFFFVEDNENKFDPYSVEAAEIAGFPFEEDAPNVEGFFYCSASYQDYLDALRESQQEHPHNTAGLPWII